MAIYQHDIVQIVDQAHPWDPCLLVVTEVKPWGVQAYACIPESNDGSKSPAQAYNRLRWEQIAHVGTCVVVPAPDADEEDRDDA